MADEPRRSGRATKGQHTKNDEDPPDAVKKRGKGGRGKAAKKAAEEVQEEEEEEEAIIRCICGYVVEDKNDKRAMISCDKCLAWQHNVCMGLSEDEDEIPEEYFCERCKPQNHKETLAAIAKGEKIWEARQAEAQREEEEKKARKRKGGRKSKGARVSEAAPAEKQEPSPPAAAPEPSPVAQTPSTPAPASHKVETSHKRKVPPELPLEASQAGESTTSSKVRKVSTPKEPKIQARRQSSHVAPAVRRDSKEIPLQAELVENIEELHSDARKRAAKALVRMFVDSTRTAQKDGTFKLPTGQTEDAFGLRLGLTVEYSLYMNFWGHGENPNPPYGEKLRTILHNVKDNSNLRSRLLKGSLSPHDLTNMSSLEMARKELQEETAQIMKQNEKQHVLVQEEGPRMRRTHKGDELIVDESQHMTSNEPTQSAPRRHQHADGQAESPEEMSPRSPNAVELPHDIGKSPTSPTSTNITNPLRVDTNRTRPKPPPERRRSTASNAFNMDSVWSSVDSPSTHRPIPIPNTPAAAPGPGAKADPEIDHLLKDDDDEEPYSPMDYEMEPGTVWRGSVVMPTIAEFKGSARHVAGADLHDIFPWEQLMPPVLTVEGRIPVDRASDYLCGLRYSKTTDVCVVAVAPAEHQADREQFDKLFAYFTSRARYGVVGRSPVANVRDVYVVPLEAGDAKKPDFIELLQDASVENDRPQRLLLVTYVIKTRTDAAPPPGGATATLPSAAAAIATTTMTPSGNAMSPLNPQTGFAPPPSSNTNAPNLHPHPSQESQQSFPQQQQPHSPPQGTTTTTGMPSAQKTGMEAARLVLGPDLVQAPTVGQLLASAPETSEAQWLGIRQVLEAEPAARNDWGVFVKSLQARVGGSGAQ